MLVLACLIASRAGADDVPRVHEIRFEGVDAVPERTLRANMLTRTRKVLRLWKKRPEFSQGIFEEDLHRLEQVYRDRGYYEARVSGAIESPPDDPEVELRVTVEEGEPVRLVDLDVEIDGAAPIDADTLIAASPMRAGDVFSVSQYQKTRAFMLRRLADVGHPSARLRGGAEVVVETRSARIDWRISPGPSVEFGEFRVEGLERVDESIIAREIRIDPGDAYSETALQKMRDRILRLQLFRYAAVSRDTRFEEPPFEPPPGDGANAEALETAETAGATETTETAETEDAPPPDGGAPASEGAAPGDDARAGADPPAHETWPMLIRVEERPPRSVSIGGGWASGQGPRGAVRWTHRNFLGGARRFSASVSGSPLEQLANLRFQQPHVFDTRASLIVNSLWRRRSRQSYDSNTAEFSIGPRWSLGPGWVFETSYRFGWTDVNNVTDTTNEVLRAQKRSGLLSGFGARVRRARLDHPTNPTRGTWLQLGVATNLKALGSDFDWMRYDAEARGYVPLGRTVAAFRAHYSAIDPLGSTEPDGVPLGERLFLGGPHTGRGFPFEELGPLDAEGEPVGGVTSLLLSAEWRIPVWGPVTLVGFVDAGQVSTSPFAFDATDIGVGTGAGLAFATPIGPIAGHVAYPVRPLESTQRVRFAITIGHSF